MANENAQLAEFAKNIWSNFLKTKVREENKDSITFYRAEVVSNNGGNKLTIQRPYDEPYQVSCTDGMAEVASGDQVIVLKFGNDTNSKNHLVVSSGDGATFGGGSGGGGSTAHGLPAGGATGQVLVKNSATNYDASWQTIITHSRYVHEQAAAASVWTINHSLNCFPSVTVVDSAKSTVYGEVQYTNMNTLTITFTAAFKGTAYLN